MNNSEPIRFNDKRYFRHEYQEFKLFEESEKLLRDYCNKCRLKKGCNINYHLKLAMENNYPFFPEEFVRLEFCGTEYSLDSFVPFPPETLITCRAFKPKQLEFAFVE